MAKLTRRSKKFGWGYSFSPTGETAYSIADPGVVHEGTPKQVIKAAQENRTFNAHKNTAFHRTGYFLGGKQIDTEFPFDWEFGQLLDGDVDEIEVKFI